MGGGGETLVGKSSRRHKGGNNVQESVSEGERGREREREREQRMVLCPKSSKLPPEKNCQRPATNDQPATSRFAAAAARRARGWFGALPKSSKLPTDSKIASAPKPTISPQHRVLARTRPGTPGFGLMLCPKSSKLPPEKCQRPETNDQPATTF